MPNLRGTSPVGRDGGGRSYTARTDGGEESSGRSSGCGDECRGADEAQPSEWTNARAEGVDWINST